MAPCPATVAWASTSVIARSISSRCALEGDPFFEHPFHDVHHQPGDLGPQLFSGPPGRRLDVGTGPADKALVLLLTLLA